VWLRVGAAPIPLRKGNAILRFPQNRQVVLIFVFAVGLAAGGLAEDRLTVWGLPPKQKPHFTKAAEGFPPLPLPVVPQRRTEKKRPPAPPKLLANVENLSFVGWKGSPGSVDQLLQNARRHLNLWYGWEQLDLQVFTRQHTSGVRHRTPILYFCAYYPLDLTKDQRIAITDYVMGGGTLVINCCGQQEAYASVRSELRQMFSELPLRALPADHPLYHAFYTIETVTYLRPSETGAEPKQSSSLSRIRAITLGTRAAVIVSYEDLACGWNEWNNPAVDRMSAADSTRIGLNLITYVTAEQRLAKFLAKSVDVAGPTIRPRQKLVFPQLIHNGNWNPNPSAVPLLLKEIASNTSVAVEFARHQMQLKDPALFAHPLLYMTGTWGPDLTREETALLHRYLTSGGLLIADSASGRIEFDVAFRKLCSELFPEQPLEPLPADHPLFNCFHKIDQVVLNHRPEPVAPMLEAVMYEGRPVVLYSPLGLSDGWAHLHSAYARSYSTADALKLGTNIVVFAMQ